MFEDIIHAIDFSTRFEGEEVDLGALHHKTIPFSEKNFRHLPSHGSGTISFVDGGNAELLRSPSFSLQLCRVAHVTYDKGERIEQERKEFFVLVTIIKGSFVVKTFGEDISFSVSIDDEHFKSGTSRGTPSSVVSAIRRFAELKLAASLNADVIVLDGSLQQTYPFEDKFMRELYKKKVIGFCKTSSVLTKSGNSALALMNLHKGAFVYHPVAELSDLTYQAHICFVRLHEKSNYVFKIDFHGKIDDTVLALLAENSRDPVFLGYPYGLVLADKLARVSNDELEYYKTKFISQIKNDDLLRYLNALNAHDVLDHV